MPSPIMLTGGTALLCGAGIFLASSTLHASPRRHPLEIDGELGVVVFFGSAYRNSLRAFGQDGPHAGFQVTDRALWGFGGRVRMGLRVGYLVTRAAEGDTLPDYPLGARSVGDAHFHLFDAGWALRLIVTRSTAPGTSNARFGFDLEVGAVAALTTWPRGSEVNLLPRLGLSTVLLFGTRSSVSLGMRLGVQYIPSGGASGGAWGDPAFAGVTFGFELGGRP